MFTRFVIALIAGIAASLGAASAQDYPNRPITLVVPYAAGGGNDVMARIVGEKMSKTLGQQVVIDNRPGAGGALATRQVAKAAPDGYTLVIGGTGSLAVNPTLLPNVGYDVRKDFAPVGLIGSSAMIVLIHPSLPAKTIPELIALAKKEPGKLTFASAGVGSGIHLGAELFANMAGIKLVHVPYKGTGPALTDLIGGHVSIYFSSLPSAIGHVKDGKVRALAVTATKRSNIFPDLPTVAEAACPVSKRRCATASWRPPGRRGRSSTSSTPRCDRHWPIPTPSRASLATAPRQSRPAPRNMPPISTARSANGRRW
jgi:tripartite-type tricarboxylate transporter receptor subunit TctC